MDEDLLEKLARYEAKHGFRRVRNLGFGIHGIVFLLECQKGERRAVKIHASHPPFDRECAVYARLAEHHITEILGHQVPCLIGTDEELLAIEMSVVDRPFVLDFASAHLDFPPMFNADVLEHMDHDMQENFGPHYAKARQILAELEDLGIFQMDPSPRNIGFREGE